MSSGALQTRRTARIADEIEALAVTAMREQLVEVHGRALLGELAERVVAGELDPYTASDELLAAAGKPVESAET